MNLAGSWEEVTFGQLLAIKPEARISETVAVLQGRSEEEVLQDRFPIDQVYARLSFLKTDITPSVWVWAPKNLEMVRVGAYEDIKNVVAKFKNKPEDLHHYPIIYATLVMKNYDTDRADHVAGQVMGLPCTQVIGTVQHYLSDIMRIEKKWADQFPKSGYSNEQIAAGFEKINQSFGFFGTLFYMEEATKFSRKQLLKMSVAEFKYNLLYLAWRSDATKKYQDIQAAKVKRR